MAAEDVWAWRVPGPEMEPELTVERWQVVEVFDGRRYLIGYCVDRDEARVSTALDGINLIDLMVRTQSGRIYRLLGPAGHDQDAEALWRKVADARKIDSWKYVTSEIIVDKTSHAGTQQGDMSAS